MSNHSDNSWIDGEERPKAVGAIDRAASRLQSGVAVMGEVFHSMSDYLSDLL